MPCGLWRTTFRCRSRTFRIVCWGRSTEDRPLSGERLVVLFAHLLVDEHLRTSVLPEQSIKPTNFVRIFPFVDFSYACFDLIRGEIFQSLSGWCNGFLICWSSLSDGFTSKPSRRRLWRSWHS